MNGDQKKKRVKKIEGVEITKASDSFLASRFGMCKTGTICCRVVSICAFLLFSYFGIVGFGWFFGIVAGIIAGVGFMIPSFFLNSMATAINEELEKRMGKDSSKKEDFTNASKKASNKVKVAFIAIVPVGIILGLIFVALLNGGKDSDEVCRNCGREISLVSGYDYCYDCYEGFVDWQKENWTTNN